MESIEFVEWVAQNHYYLCNIEKGECIWKNEDGEINSKQLFKNFKEDKSKWQEEKAKD